MPFSSTERAIVLTPSLPTSFSQGTRFHALHGLHLSPESGHNSSVATKLFRRLNGPWERRRSFMRNRWSVLVDALRKLREVLREQKYRLVATGIGGDAGDTTQAWDECAS